MAPSVIRRTVRRLMRVVGVIVTFGVAVTLIDSWSSAFSSGSPSLRGSEDAVAGPRNLQTDGDDDGQYPRDAFTFEQRQQGWITLHCIGILYTFAALNEVCDVFFVPALEVLVEALDMDMTVAGATFMAAGGSAPELFTSFFGTFVARTNVGFGTIVGSAVFNILFVIGVCAIAASAGVNDDGTRRALELTPYPLFRDSMFYILSLITLVIFFYDQQIEWWEALLQFLVYVLYVSFMMRNDAAEKRALAFCPCLRPTHPSPRVRWLRSKLLALVNRSEHALEHPFEATPIKTSTAVTGAASAAAAAGPAVMAVPSAPSPTPGAIAATSASSRLVSVSAALASGSADSKETRKPVTTQVKPVARKAEPDGKAQQPTSSVTGPAAAVAAAKKEEDDGDDDDDADVTDAAPAPAPAPAPASADDAAAAAAAAAGQEGQEDPKGGSAVASKASSAIRRGKSSKESWHKLRQAVKALDAMSAMIKTVEDDDGEPEGVDEDYMAWPRRDDEDDDGNVKGCYELRVVEYLIMFPIRIVLFATVPDPVPKPKSCCCFARSPLDRLCCGPTGSEDGEEEPEPRRTHEGEKKHSPIFLLTFLLSIVWVGAFSYLMVWWAALAGNVFGISPEIMGLTVLAAGTSVPDLLTSVIVAAKGYGDMAVSSSIGSNVFDVTVGLPLPWFLFSLAQGAPIVVGSQGLFSSLVVLFAMLVCVVIAIAAAGWKLSRALGAAMFVLYAIFLTYSLLTLDGIIPSF